MSSIAIKVEDLSKIYRLGEIGTGTISHDLHRWVAKIRGKEDPFLKIGESNDRASKGGDVVYSLKDLNFEIRQGDAVGIIGSNGAGKSTLLKILSRITSPTTGKINIKGRVASLLEVGTGFHPELTGKENIYLNGAILGMRKKEIDRKLDAIIDFSGVERYIDTPVKRYSSGMYVRLAFAVAAHLESEILIVDEVLAVGDSEFQKKCLGKMGEVSKGEGRAVLFVSHNMVAVESLCNNGLLLSNGELKVSDDIRTTVRKYLDEKVDHKNSNLANRKDRSGNQHIYFTKVSYWDLNKNEIGKIQSGQDFYLNLHFKKEIPGAIKNLHVAIALEDKYEQRITHLNNDLTNTTLQVPSEMKEGIISILIKNVPIASGFYDLIIHSESEGETLDWIKKAAKLEIEYGDFYGTGKIMPADDGNVLLKYQFSIL